MLIKPPGTSRKPLTASPLMTQLVDIPATIVDLLNLPPIGGDGQSVFSNYKERDVSVFTGFYRLKDREVVILGRKTNRTMIDHISYSKLNDWRVLEDIEAHHEGW